jgi:hypothetical protein
MCGKIWTNAAPFDIWTNVNACCGNSFESNRAYQFSFFFTLADVMIIP